MKIHISDETKTLLKSFNTFVIEERGKIEVKVRKGFICLYEINILFLFPLFLVFGYFLASVLAINHVSNINLFVCKGKNTVFTGETMSYDDLLVFLVI